MSEWQPIETAPKDGTQIITVRIEEGRDPDYEIDSWFVMPPHYEYREADDGLFSRVEVIRARGHWSNNGHRATHWMPLPTPPRSRNAERGR